MQVPIKFTGVSFSLVTSQAVNAIGPVTWNSGADWISATFTGSVLINDDGIVMDITANLVERDGPSGANSEPSAALLFGVGTVVIGARRRR